jgi:hypothetical protein
VAVVVAAMRVVVVPAVAAMGVVATEAAAAKVAEKVGYKSQGCRVKAVG